MTEPRSAPSQPAARFFAQGEKLVVAKKSIVVDKERAHENLAKGAPPIEQDVTGVTGEVCGDSYQSPGKDGETCVPLRLGNEAVIAVPESRLERVDRSVGRSDGGGQSTSSPVSRETMTFWERVFGRKK